MPTIFEKIIKREIPANIIYEDDLVIAFLDITQATKGHTLVCPKVPYKDIFELPADVASHLFKVVVDLSKVIKKALNPAGLNTLNNNGLIASQSVFHFHMHIIPRYDNDDFVNVTMINHMTKLNSDELNKLKNAITAFL
ncbi:MAG TPA: HIT family protein [Acholeplasma sp.]|nr:HIT family protein [Acholeplasma sp.]